MTVNRQKKGGFTLMEAVICLALVGVISAAYVAMATGSIRVYRAGEEYGQETADLLSALATGDLGEDVKDSPLGRVEIQLDGGYYLALERRQLSLDGEEGITYYRFNR